MKTDKILSRLLVGFIVLNIIVPNVFAANNYTNDDVTSNISNYSVNTKYEAGTYIEPIEVYNIDLTWEDLHWVFIYSGDITNPSNSVWMTKNFYESCLSSDTNTLNQTILNNIDSYRSHEVVEMNVVNNSNFAVNILASVEQIDNLNYTNPAELKIAKTGEQLWSSQASINGLAKSNNSTFLIKPTATRFVNNTGATANVTGEVKLTFTKYN